MKIHKLINTQNGSSLVEVLVAIAMAGIMLPALVIAIVSSSTARPTIEHKITATSMLHQIIEATRSAREADWNNISTNGTYHTIINGNNWTLNNGSHTSGDFTDQVVINDVQRNFSGDIVTSGGTVDSSTKHILAIVSWNTPTSSSVYTDFYLSRWQNEKSWTQTSLVDFNSDTLNNTSTTNTSGGEVELSAGQTSGQVTSITFDATKTVGFNLLTFTTVIPSGSDIKFQIATNNDNSTWNYIGPDGTNSSFYSSPSSIPLVYSSGRYFRYQANLSTTNSTIPIINDVTLTYSP